MPLKPEDIASLERATLKAVPPLEMKAWRDWLLPMDQGTVGRARSAVPLRHDRPEPADIARIDRFYTQAGREPWFRVPDAPAWKPVHQALDDRGFLRVKPTHVMTAPLASLLSVPAVASCDLATEPDDAWMAAYLGEGFDAVDGAHRVRLMGRAKGCLYASVRVAGEAQAVGMASLGEGWLGIHGMRTAPRARGRGLASGIVRAMALMALERRLQKAFLQVEASNTRAIALYSRFGFTPAWTYAYWR